MANNAKLGNTTFHIGDTIRVHYKLIEKEKIAGKAKREVKEEIKERIQVFEGIVISIRGEGENKSFTVRRIGVGAIGIERILPLNSPWITKVTVKKKGKVKRAKLYYLRGKIGRAAEKLKEQTKVEKEEKKIEPLAKDETSKEPQKPEKKANLSEKNAPKKT